MRCLFSTVFLFSLTYIMSQDVIPPQVVTLPQDTVFECGTQGIIDSLTRWFQAGAGVVFDDDSGQYNLQTDISLSHALDIFQASQDTLCGRTRQVRVLFSAIDSAGNVSQAFPATFSTADNTPPLIINGPQLSFSCKEGIHDTLISWIQNRGHFSATDSCSDTLYWTTFIFNIFDKETGIRISGGRGNIDFGPYPVIPDGICQWGMSINFTVVDECGNASLTPASAYNFNVTDDLPPRFIRPPGDTTIMCKAIPEPEIQVEDDCFSMVDVRFSETSTQSPDSLQCGHYNYTLTRTWEAEDNCGNVSEHIQVLNVRDNEKPQAIFQDTLTLSCTEFIQFPDSLYLEVSDECSTVRISLSDEGSLEKCVSEIRRTYILKDVCDNTDTVYQYLQVVQDSPPMIVTAASPVGLSCDTHEDIALLLSNWLDSLGGTRVVSSCGPLQSFAAVKGSYDVNDITTFPGTKPEGLSGRQCPSEAEGYLSFIEVDFVFYDTCGNIAVSPAIFGISDTLSPVIVSCKENDTFILDQEDCEILVSLTPPRFSDNCQSNSPLVQRTIRQPVTSATPPGPEAVVDPLVLRLGPFNSWAAPPVTDADIRIRLINLDIDDATEFFIVYNEDGQRLGVTPTGVGQCADTSMVLTLALSDINRWLSDGFIDFRFDPFIVPGSPVLSINNFCGGSFIEVRMEYTTDIENVLQLSYQVNGGPKNALLPEDMPQIMLTEGIHEVRFRATDCAGNHSLCISQVEVRDETPPDIVCPDDIITVLKEGLCQDTILLPLNLEVTDNCSGNRIYNQWSPISREASLLSFIPDPNTQKLRARDKQIIFNNVFPVRFTQKDVELEIEFFGKNNIAGRQFDITGPDGTVLGRTVISSSPNDSCGLSVTTFKIPYDRFNSWINNRQVTFLSQPISSDIGPCGPITPGSTNDNVSFIRGRLKYSDASFSISSSGATILTPRPVPTDISQYEWVLNRGINNVTLFTQDAAGNEGFCQFQILIQDQEKPVAQCKNASLTVNPSGIEGTVIEAGLINNNSTDNCSIVSYQVIPEAIDCSLSGTDVPVTLLVTDESGNTDQCQSVIRARPYEVQPTFSSGLCANDTLKLFANVPASSVAGAYTFHWTGPRPGIEFFTENPVIPNADQSFSGVYILTVTGFNNCISVGSVTVNVNPITNPTLTSSQEEICEGENIILRTTQYSDEVEYEWYSGIFPTGILLSVTSNPELVVNPAEPGPLFFYVIAKGPDCRSNPSSLIKVTVHARPVAAVNSPLLSLCEGEDIILGTPVTGSGFEYLWTGPNGYSETERNPRIIQNATLNEAGDYQLVITSQGCVSDTATTRVILLESPEAPVIVGNDIFCEGVVFSLVASGVSGVDRYEWYLNGRLFSTTQDNSLIIPGAIEALQGEWRVKVIKGICESPFSEAKTVAIDLALQIGLFNNGPVCRGDSITLQATFVPNAIYRWVGPAGNIPNVFNPRILAVPGDYSVTITTTTGCQNNANTVVSVIDVPEVTALSDDAALCMEESDTIRFAPSVFPNRQDYIYQWEGPANFSSRDRNPVITPINLDKTGVYTLTVFNQGCPSLPFEKDVQFTLKPPKPHITYQSPVCQGEDLVLTVWEGGSSEKYYWSTPSKGLVLTTSDSLIVNSAMNVDNGFYKVYSEMNSCRSEESDSLWVMITPRPSPIPVFGRNIICYGDTIQIRSQNITGLKYHWSGPQFSSQQAGGVTIFPATQNNSGLYSLFVEKDGCLSSVSSDILIEVLDEIKTPVITDNSISLCYKDILGVELCLDASSLDPGSQYELRREDKILLEGTGPCFYLTELEDFQEGVHSLFIRAQKGDCFSELSNEIILTINRPPDIEAEVMESGIRICPGDEVRLVSLSGPPIVGLSWKSPDPDLIISPSDGRSPFVLQLKPGENTIYLTYSVSGCPDFSTDTVLIYQEFLPEAQNDEYTVGYGQPARLDILNNDDFPENTRVSIIQLPLSGQARLEGDTILYEPDLRNIQPQTLTYRICAEFCEDLCDEATVSIRIDDNIDCRVPTIFTPNNDGINDFFIIPCLETGRFPQNKISVFNEWGDQVHFASPYDNNWDGTYGGNPLPVGTYFFVVELEPGRTPVNGFLILQR